MKRILAIGVAGLLLASGAWGGTESGSTEGTISFVFLKPESGPHSQILVGGMGFFVPAWLEIKGTVVWFGDEGNTEGAIGGGIDLHIAPGQDIVPFVGAGILASIGDRDLSDDTMLDFHVGLKQFVGSGVSVNYTLNQWKSTGRSQVTYGVAMIGVSFYL